MTGEFFLTASYDFRVTGNLEKAEQTCLAWAQAYPRDVNPPPFSAESFTLPSANTRSQSKKPARRSRIDPDFALGYSNLAFANVFLDRLEQAEKTLQLASARKLEASDALILPYDIAFLKDDQAGMEREAARTQAKSESEAQSWYYQAFAMAYSGHMQTAEDDGHAGDGHGSAGVNQKERLSGEPDQLCWRHFSPIHRTPGKAKAALDLSRDREVEYGAALAFALTGDTAQTQTLANDLQKRFGRIPRSNSVIYQRCVPFWR